VLPAIAAAVSIAENTGSGRSLPQIVSDALRGKQRLLLLDNFEHLIPAAPRVADLLAACPS